MLLAKSKKASPQLARGTDFLCCIDRNRIVRWLNGIGAIATCAVSSVRSPLNGEGGFVSLARFWSEQYHRPDQMSMNASDTKNEGSFPGQLPTMVAILNEVKDPPLPANKARFFRPSLPGCQLQLAGRDRWLSHCARFLRMPGVSILVVKIDPVKVDPLKVDGKQKRPGAASA